MISNNVNNSILPTIINIIRLYLVRKLTFWKSKSLIPYEDEFTVFINVSIDIFKHRSKSIPESATNDVRTSKEIINIIIERKYLLISFISKFVFENKRRFMNMFLGLLNESIWFRENLIREYILINLSPELVEKKDPPIITKSRNINWRLMNSLFKAIPMLDILLKIENMIFIKSLL